MQEVPKLTPEIRNFAKVILAAKDDPMYGISIGWFMAGAWYMDAISMLVLTLPDDDPTLAQILESMRSGALCHNEIIAKNILRFGMAMEESAGFMSANVKAESLLLHARALVQGATRQPQVKPLEDAVKRLLKTLDDIRRQNKEQIKVGISLRERWRAALNDPLWWLALGAIGMLIFL